MTMPGPGPDDRVPPPVDDPFMERLFGIMCRHIPVRRNDTFVDEVRRWYETLRFMAALRPRTVDECLLAADVSIKNQFVLETLARGRTEAGRRRRMQSREFMSRTRDLNASQLHYDVIRSRPVQRP